MSEQSTKRESLVSNKQQATSQERRSKKRMITDATLSVVIGNSYWLQSRHASIDMARKSLLAWTRREQFSSSAHDGGKAEAQAATSYECVFCGRGV